MRIPAVDTYLEYIAGVDGAGVNNFVAPDLTPSGMPYDSSLSELVVHVDDVEVTTFTENPDGTISFTSDLKVGQSVKIWRETPVLESLVEFPVPTRYTPRDNNKAITQLLLCIQEVWGGLKELKNELTTAQTDLQDYVNQAIAAVFEFSGTAVATWSTSVSAGDETLATPYSFTRGLLMVGGSLYNLSDPTHATLDNTGANTIIEFNEPMVADMDAILIVL
jgi:hypothetical protein